MKIDDLQFRSTDGNDSGSELQRRDIDALGKKKKLFKKQKQKVGVCGVRVVCCSFVVVVVVVVVLYSWFALLVVTVLVESGR
jgi:hypothetical protein